MIEGSRPAKWLLLMALAALIPAGLATSQDRKSPAPAEPVVTHPFVAGFERFSPTSSSPGDLASSGRLLLGELNCVACHMADERLSASLMLRQAPVLDAVGSRVRVAFLREFLSDPQKVKPGTTMPDLLAALSEGGRKSRIEALVHFLASTGTVLDSASQPKDVRHGEQHFHRLGCVACHAPRKDPPPLVSPREADEELEEEKPRPLAPATIVPLGNIPGKYTLNSLAKFLKDPLAVRPSGRMPSFSLNDAEAREIASYFFKDHQVPPNVNFTWYEGSWDKLPDLASLKPRETGQASGFDLSVAGRTSNFAIRFSGYLHVPADGQYEFWLGSDDGSQLRIDGELVSNNDGIHAHAEMHSRRRLSKGAHPIQVDYMQGGGEWTLSLEIAGKGLPRQPAAGLVTLTADPPQPAVEPGAASTFKIDPDLVEKGREFFASTGCANCHTLRENGKPIAPALSSRPLAVLNAERGCLSGDPTAMGGAPHFSLTEAQRRSIAVGLAAPVSDPRPTDVVSRAMLALNCHACHSRDGRGGVEEARNTFFETTIKEMGDEGRLPPPLDGVGDKLNESYLNHVLQNGAKDRRYMLARMPKFGSIAARGLASAFAAVDLKTGAAVPELDEPLPRVEATGRHLMGEKGLSCAKCHPFKEHAEPGIQALQLNLMARRLREDWFYRYLLDPQTYRPGTRMPGFFPEGRSTNREVLDGNPGAQMKAMWAWLSLGDNAAVPPGLLHNAIVLTPTTEPIVYRNFIQGLSPRGIAVGYPEQVHLAFDAELFGLALLWQGQFIDASKHWVGRGPGFQGPLGDNVLSLPNAVPLAVLASETEPWPSQARDQGYRFRGYRLDKDRRPTFLYTGAGVEVSDFPEPVKNDSGGSFVRTLILNPSDAALTPPNVFYRAAVGKEIKPVEGVYVIDSRLKITVRSSGKRLPFLRPAGDRQELLVPIEFENGVANLRQTYTW